MSDEILSFKVVAHYIFRSSSFLRKNCERGLSIVPEVTKKKKMMGRKRPQFVAV